MLESESGHLIQHQLTTSFLNTGLIMKETDKTEDDLVLIGIKLMKQFSLFFFVTVLHKVCEQGELKQRILFYIL